MAPRQVQQSFVGPATVRESLQEGPVLGDGGAELARILQPPGLVEESLGGRIDVGLAGGGQRQAGGDQCRNQNQPAAGLRPPHRTMHR